MKPDFSDYIIAVLFLLGDEMPHSMDQCVSDILKNCSIEFDLESGEPFILRENVYYTSIKTIIVMLEANGIVDIDDNHNTMLTLKGKKYYEKNKLEICERWRKLFMGKNKNKK